MNLPVVPAMNLVVYFNITVAEIESMVKPDCATDDIGVRRGEEIGGVSVFSSAEHERYAVYLTAPFRKVCLCVSGLLFRFTDEDWNVPRSTLTVFFKRRVVLVTDGPQCVFFLDLSEPCMQPHFSLPVTHFNIGMLHKIVIPHRVRWPASL